MILINGKWDPGYKKELNTKSKNMDQIINFYRINDKILTGGQPRMDQFALLREEGVKTVINLALPDSDHAVPDEGRLVTALKMCYIHIPVDFMKPQAEDLQRFYIAMELTLNERSFIHCAMNFRVSAFVYLYRLNILGESEAEARNDLLKIWTPYQNWENFIKENLKR